MKVNCEICNSLSNFLLKQGGYNFFRCSHCALMFVHPLPSDEELGRVYSPKEKYQAHKIHKDYTKETNSKYTKIFKELGRIITPPSHVLDVGASDGDFLYVARQKGFTVAGIEPNITTADIANQHSLNVFNGFLENSPFEKYSFDVLRLGDVLEHSNKPNALLQECNSYLRTGGLLVISIPNMDSFWAKVTGKLYAIFGVPWSVLTPPHHLFYFRENNLDLIFKNNGFSKVAVWYHRPPTFKYEFGNTHLLGELKRQKSLKSVARFILGLFLYGLMYVIDIIITPFKHKDFGLVSIYKKNA
jgi:2-polyprenyl-3-methyl-5-hydroxy-6-metoxy-1,4-benzoquinol methylase